MIVFVNAYKMLQRVVSSFIIILFINSFINCQQIWFSVNGSVNYIPAYEDQRYREGKIDILDILNDSMAISHTGIAQSVTSTDYKTSPGFSAGAKLHFDIADRISIGTGLLTEFFSFQGEMKYISSHIVITSTDTIAYKRNIIDIYHCDYYENSISDLGPIQNGIKYKMLNLTVPLEVSVKIIPGKLYLDGGVYMQTPLYTLTRQEYYASNMRIENGKTICRYYIRVEENNSGIRFSNIQLGLSGTLGLVLTNQIHLNLGIAKTLSNVFDDRSDNLFSTGNLQVFKPMRISAGLQYNFGYFSKNSGIKENW